MYIKPLNETKPIRFHKYQALGNSYIILEANTVLPEQAQRICNNSYGVGSDGILHLDKSRKLQIINPDGSTAEKSGNGLRIFARYWWENGHSNGQTGFDIHLEQETVSARILDERLIQIKMGQLKLIGPSDRPQTIVIDDRTINYWSASIGNPHCVIFCDTLSAEEIQHWGPKIETHRAFPNRTNVQFAKLIDKNTVEIEIWERGAGYTLASGSSSCAVAGVAHHQGMVEAELTVRMPGGQMQVNIGPDKSIQLTGPVNKICDGTLAPDMWL